MNVKTVAAKFFELPMEQKKKFSVSLDDIQEYGLLYIVSEEQKLDLGDAFVLVIYPARYQILNFWPSEPTAFIEAVEKYPVEARVAKEPFAALSLVMGLEKDDLVKLHKEVLQGLLVNYYPTCSDPDKVIGVSPCSDATTLTIVLQVDEVTGLQIQHPVGWVPVKPIQNALVLNIGDILEVLGNGRYRSIEHRAMTNKSTARISVASFISPQYDVEIAPLKAKTDCHLHKPKYENIHMENI